MRIHLDVLRHTLRIDQGTPIICHEWAYLQKLQNVNTIIYDDQRQIGKITWTNREAPSDLSHPAYADFRQDLVESVRRFKRYGNIIDFIKKIREKGPNHAA